MLTREDLGRREQRRLGPGLDGRAMAMSATTVLPQPTSPCKRRNMRPVERMSPPICVQRLALRAGEREGQGGGDLVPEPAVAFERPPVGAAEAAAQQRERKLTGEQLIESEARRAPAHGARHRRHRPAGAAHAAHR